MDKKLIENLNKILQNELVAINQYFLHGKILEDQGFKKLSEISIKESKEEMMHADTIIGRILFLKAIPQMTNYKDLKIGKNVQEIFKNDFDLEIIAISDLKEAISYCYKIADYVTKDILEKILISEENHLDFLNTQIDLIEKIGAQNYLATKI